MYTRKRYTPLQDGPTIMDVIKNKASSAATNVVGGAASSASGAVNKAFTGVKLPPVAIGIAPETMKKVYIAVGILGTAAVLTAIISKS